MRAIPSLKDGHDREGGERMSHGKREGERKGEGGEGGESGTLMEGAREGEG